ncbi:MAG: CAP domain-containing protein [Parcubacteria group bacterium]|nr:CAP domain-containing protein [Parcubacteria group bacterium]
MLKPGQKNNYQEFLRKKKKFAQKIKQGKKFKDTDRDGLSDYEEKYIYGTDPKNPDTDHDGMNDGAEVKRGRNPLGPGRLKDLFIPHEGNNYLPQALKPRRLLFHAISIVAIKSVVIIFVLFYPLSAWLSPDLALAKTKKIIELTNNLRQAVSLPTLLENQQLAQAAFKKAEDMALNQYFAHVSPAGLGLKNWLEKIGYEYSTAGENLAVGFSRAEDVVAAWKNSPTHYDNIIDPGFKEIGAAVADGRFNQVDTAFMAQYFGTPATPERSDGGQGAPVKNQAAAAMAPPIKKAVKKIAIDQQTAVLSIKSAPPDSGQAVQIQTTLPEDTAWAEVIIDNRKITLNKTPDQDNGWQAVSLISRTEEKNILNPLIPAAITVRDSAGIIKYGQLDWDEVKLIKTTPLEHYQLYKNNPAAAMSPIINLSGLYFKLILIIALIALLLNIFIEIRKQQAHIIFYSLAFISLLAVMIVF